MAVLVAPEDRKLNEEEVLNELQSASEWFAEHGRNTNTAIIGICKRAIDLINQKNEVIEELLDANEHLAVLLNEANDEGRKARAEAIKEFAERVKEAGAKSVEVAFYGDGTETIEFITLRTSLVDQIAKEMGVM